MPGPPEPGKEGLPEKFIWIDLEFLREVRRRDGMSGVMRVFEDFFNQAMFQINMMDKEEGRGIIEIPKFTPPNLKG
jgi:hypothetical protein